MASGGAGCNTLVLDEVANECDDAEDVTPLRFPMASFPSLPQRHSGYWTEPITGVCVVTILSVLLVAFTQSIALSAAEGCVGTCRIAVSAIWAEAVIALCSTAYLIFGAAGEIRRSPGTCYPIPAEVEQRLLSSQSLHGMANVPGPDDNPALGSYCVRCLVWRPKGAGGHHCNICQRCCTGFDHHCGVFGRCIVRNNMPCFVTVIGMLFCGIVTVMMAALVTNSAAPGDP